MQRPPRAPLQLPIAKKGCPTFAKRIPAQQDKSVTSMVPVFVRVCREAAAGARLIEGRNIIWQG